MTKRLLVRFALNGTATDECAADITRLDKKWKPWKPICTNLISVRNRTNATTNRGLETDCLDRCPREERQRPQRLPMTT